ncbi:DUF350 domain-containing protein [[Brevibacterium] frigoritolerans]|nr:DUF350 domain-containing protein [Peribacillus frigoritolerans]
MYLINNFLSYVGTGFVLLIIGLILFELTTKVKELKLISERNETAAFVLGGKTFGLALVLGSAIANSINLNDMILWGSIGIVTQIILFYLAQLIMFIVRFSINKAIEDNNRAVGIILFILSMSVGWIVAQCLTYE